MSGDVRKAVIEVMDSLLHSGEDREFSSLDAILTADAGFLLNEPIRPDKTVLDAVEEAADLSDYYDGDKSWGRAKTERLWAFSAYLSERGAKTFRQLRPITDHGPESPSP